MIVICLSMNTISSLCRLHFLISMRLLRFQKVLHVNSCEFELECIHACLGFLHAGNIHHKSFQYARLSTIRHSLLQFFFFLFWIGSCAMRKLHRNRNRKKFRQCIRIPIELKTVLRRISYASCLHQDLNAESQSD